MMDAYLDALIDQALERTKVLRGKIKNPLLSAEFTGLQSRCEGRLDEIIRRLNFLAEDSDVKAKENVPTRIRLMRRAFEDLASLECTGIAALNRPSGDDVLLNKVLFRIYREIKYPLNPPTLTCLSQSYYCVYPPIGLLSVPLAESDFLLHLPDLYHELGHPILTAIDDPRAENFQDQYVKFNEIVSAKFSERMTNILLETGPKEYHIFEAKVLLRSWVKYWSREFFCDLFAVYTLGPAYAWAHLHLTASTDADPYAVNPTQVTTHPPDQARMEAMLFALDLLGLRNNISEIKSKWDKLIAMTGCRQSALYRKACPTQLLEQAAIHALEGTKAIGCRLADDKATGEIHDLLNEAWDIFWKDPRMYLSWERKKVSALNQRYKE